MAAQRAKVTYANGEVAEIKITPRAQVATERHIGGDWAHLAMLANYYMAWVVLMKENPEIGGFDAWLDTVDDVSLITDEESPKPEDPTPPDQSLAPLSD